LDLNTSQFGRFIYLQAV